MSRPLLWKQPLAALGADGLTERLKRALAAISLVGSFCAVFALAPDNRAAMQALFGSVAFNFTGAEFLFATAFAYSCALLVYHLLAPDLGLTKSVRFFRVLRAFACSPAEVFRHGLERDDRTAVLTTLLKGFFAPMMAMALMSASMDAVAHGVKISGELGLGMGFPLLFNQHGFWIAMRTIIFIDLLIFTVGYLVESPRLGNEIRSVDPTLLGWAAALLCYPPFNSVTGRILGSQVSDFPQFDDPTLHLVLNIVMLMLMAVYASASVALGLKASNLTHRGIVARGPYALIRHPAYVCKNMAWWIGSIPSVSFAFERAFYDGILAIASVVGWSMLYALRALTEENHLRGVDGEYAAYAAKVRFRFLPGIY